MPLRWALDYRSDIDILVIDNKGVEADKPLAVCFLSCYKWNTGNNKNSESVYTGNRDIILHV